MSKYSSLMDYLDEQDSDCNGQDSDEKSNQLPSPPQYRCSSRESPASSMPNSPPGYSTRRQYVWDEVEGERGQNRYSDDSRSTASNTVRAASVSSRNSGGDTARSQDSASIGEMVQAVRTKVDAMKIELRNRTESVRQLQTELARVRNAKERREVKYKNIWENRLNDLREEQSKVLKRQKDFLDKLVEDSKTLSEKDTALREKIQQSQSGSDAVLQRTLQEGQRKQERARNQWIADEKASFEKVLASKMESMKTQAAKSMGVKLDATVLEYKEAAMRASEDVDAKLIQLKSALQAELQLKYSEAIEKIREERGEEVDRQRRIEERTIDEARRRQESEVLALKEKFLRNRKVLEEKMERSRRDESSSIRTGVQRVREEGAKQHREVVEAHQRALAAMLRSSSEARVALELQLREQADAWEAEYRREARDNKVLQRKRAKDLSAAKTAAETERIIMRLRAEAEEDMARVLKGLEREAESVRSQAQVAIDVVQSSENRALEQLSSLKADVASLRLRITPLALEHVQLLKECTDGRSKLIALRAGLRDAESRALAAGFKMKSSEESMYEGDDDAEGEAKVGEMREELKRKNSDRAVKLRDIDAAHEDELRRVRQKVGTLLERKEQSLLSLRAQLEDLQSDSAHLEEKLGALRLEEH